MSCKDCPPNFEEDESSVIKAHEIVDRVDEISYFRNAFVQVRGSNILYHVDSIGHVIIISQVYDLALLDSAIIADPNTATTTQVANALNTIIEALKGGTA